MTTEAQVKAVLEADATLSTLASGGIYDFTETGRLGINRTTVPGAFFSNGIIKPTILVKQRSAVKDEILQDDATQYVTVREMIECWMYDDTGYAIIEVMRARIFTLLHAVQVSGTFIVLWVLDTGPLRDDTIDAETQRSDYLARVKRSA